MEINGSSVSPPASNNHTHKHHHHHHPLPHHNHATLPSIITIVIVVTIVSFILLIAISLIIAMLRRFKSAKKNGNWNSDTSFNQGSSRLMARTSMDFNSSPDVNGGCLYGGGSGGGSQSSRLRGVQVFTYKEVEVATGQFSEANVIGNGGFGVVYRGVLSDGTVAAVKMLHRQGRQGERAFRIEVDLLCRLHSPYLVDLLGYCADQHHRLLIFEFMPNGSLHHHLHGLKQSLNWGTRLRIALDCARALEFLHEQTSPSVIHRDFKCTNILLDHNFRARVSDFGLAKMGSERINGQVSTRVLGTTGYLAPEYVSTGKLTTKSDVYSYGVVLLQLLTGRVPVDTTRPPGEHVLVSWALPRLTNRDKVMEMVDPALRGQYSKKQLIQVAAIAAMCVQKEADYRPLMTDVVQSLIPLVKNLSSSTSSRFKNQVTSSMH